MARKCGHIYTDAGLIHDLGISAWGAILVKGMDWSEIGGMLPDGTTSGAAEILAGAAALNYVADHPRLFYPDCWLFSDAQPIVVALGGELERWQERGWKSGSNRKLKAADEWQQFAIAVGRVRGAGIRLHGCFVPSHQQNHASPWNDKADKLVKHHLWSAASRIRGAQHNAG